MSVTAEIQPRRLAADAEFRLPWNRDRARNRVGSGAIVAAALIHVAVIAALFLRWPFAPVAKPVATPIPVALVMMPPPAPPKLAPKPPPKPPAPAHELVSGPDQKTTAPPAAEAKGAKAAPKPEPKRAQTEVPAPSPPKPVTPAARSQREPVKEAKRETAPELHKRVSIDRAPGDKWREGDPYLNRLRAMIESHRFYPANAVGTLGLNLQGTVYLLLTLMPDGRIADLRIEHSTHSPVLDDTARAMIERAAPFPPLPSYYPQDGATITLIIPVFPPLR